MLSRIRGAFSRKSSLLAVAAAAALFASAGNARADDKPGSAYNFSLGTTFSSHFISYGVDVWGGGKGFSPFSQRSTAWEYGTLTANITEDLSVFGNIWTDLNNNVTSSIGGPLQEIDVNLGFTYKIPKSGISITAAHGFWNYAGDIEKVADLTVSYADAWIPDFALNPSVSLHYRYDGIGAQNTGGALIAGISPGFTLKENPDYPITISFPVNAAFFSGNFQGGDGGFGYASAGAAASLRLGFVPAKFGYWDLTAAVTFFHTDSNAIPTNPRDNFFVTSVDLKLSF